MRGRSEACAPARDKLCRAKSKTAPWAVAAPLRLEAGRRGPPARAALASTQAVLGRCPWGAASCDGNPVCLMVFGVRRSYVLSAAKAKCQPS